MRRSPLRVQWSFRGSSSASFCRCSGVSRRMVWASMCSERRMRRPPDSKHAAPVLVAVAHQPPGGNGGDGLVPVLHLHRVQRDVDHEAIGADLGHLYPVAHAQHVVGAQLHAGHEGHDGVLEDQHQHGRGRAQARQQQQRRAVHQGGDDEHDGDQEHQQLAQLHIALDRVGLRGLALLLELVRLVHGVEQGADHAGHVVDGAGDGQVQDQRGPLRLQLRYGLHARLHDQRRHGLGQPLQHAVVQQHLRPFHLHQRAAHARQHTQQQPLHDKPRRAGQQHQRAQRGQGLHDGIPAGNQRPVQQEKLQGVAVPACLRPAP